MQKLRCVVERITYQNPENGYSVMKVKVKGYNDLVTLVGNLLEVPAGSVLLCEGDWKVDKSKPPVIHVFSATLSISIFVPQNEAYDDTRRSCRNYYVLQGTQSNL